MLVLDTCLLLADTIHDSSCTEINSELLIHMRNVRVNTSIWLPLARCLCLCLCLYVAPAAAATYAAVPPMLLLLAAQTMPSSKATTTMKEALTITGGDAHSRWARKLPPICRYISTATFPESYLLLLLPAAAVHRNDPALTEQSLGWRIRVNEQSTVSMANKFLVHVVSTDTVTRQTQIALPGTGCRNPSTTQDTQYWYVSPPKRTCRMR